MWGCGARLAWLRSSLTLGGAVLECRRPGGGRPARRSHTCSWMELCPQGSGQPPPCPHLEHKGSKIFLHVGLRLTSQRLDMFRLSALNSGGNLTSCAALEEKAAGENCSLQSKGGERVGKGHPQASPEDREGIAPQPPPLPPPSSGCLPRTFILTKLSYKTTGNDMSSRRLQAIFRSLYQTFTLGMKWFIKCGGGFVPLSDSEHRGGRCWNAASGMVREQEGGRPTSPGKGNSRFKTVRFGRDQSAQRNESCACSAPAPGSAGLSDQMVRVRIRGTRWCDPPVLSPIAIPSPSSPPGFPSCHTRLLCRPHDGHRGHQGAGMSRATQGTSPVSWGRQTPRKQSHQSRCN